MFLFFLLDFNVENKILYCLKKTRINRSNSNCIDLVWFDSNFILSQPN